MPGMIVMPLASMIVAAAADEFAPPRGFHVVVLLHLVLGVYLFGYIALTIFRMRRLHGRA
jgi:uncharacterized membrane protein